jgi:hypothetical protein
MLSPVSIFKPTIFCCPRQKCIRVEKIKSTIVTKLFRQFFSYGRAEVLQYMSYSCILCDRSLHSVVTPIMEKEEAGDDERLIATNPVPVAAVPVAAVSAVAVPAAAPTQDPSKTERLVQLREEESSNDSRRVLKA